MNTAAQIKHCMYLKLTLMKRRNKICDVIEDTLLHSLSSGILLLTRNLSVHVGENYRTKKVCRQAEKGEEKKKIFPFRPDQPFNYKINHCIMKLSGQ